MSDDSPPPRPLRVLELRSSLGAGGGPEKTILLGSARQRSGGVMATVCYIRDQRDTAHDIAARAAAAGAQYLEVIERHSLDTRILKKLTDLIRQGHYDILHSHDYKTDLLALVLARRTGTLPLATAHGWTGQTWKERWLYYPADKRLLPWFPMVVAVSSDVQIELIRTGCRPSTVKLLLNGIDPALYNRRDADEAHVRAEFGIEPDAFVIGSVGRLEPQKRFDLLLHAAARLKSTRPNLRVIIAGTGSLASELESLADTLGLAGSLIGHCRDVARLHHAFDVFVQASDYEGTSNAVLEAMAMRTPVVATDAGGTAEILENGVEGVVVPTGSVDALADGIARIMNDRDLSERLRAAARQRVEGPLSFDTRMSALEAIYAELSAGKRRHA